MKRTPASFPIEAIEKIKNVCKDVKIKEPLNKYSTFGIGGEASVFVNVDSMDELFSLSRIIRYYNIPYYVVGNGSNTLFLDTGFKGVVIHLKGKFEEIKAIGEMIYAGAGAKLSSLLSYCIINELGGLEFLAGIPGSVGGALRMNAGISEKLSIGNFVTEIEIFHLTDGNVTVHSVGNGGVKFYYRGSSIDDSSIILFAKFKLTRSKKEEIEKKIEEFLQVRRNKQPVGGLQVGSIFKNPPGKHAGELIESVGMKGYRCGGVYVSEKHANFIINSGTGTSDDVCQIIEEINRRVKEKYGIVLELEIKIVGERRKL
jgi:UDP-N-acetylmuramate dehydrogenase